MYSTNGFTQQARTPLTAISQVTGEWKGVASPGDMTISIAIDDLGICTIATSLGVEKGTAHIEGGLLVIRFVTGRGQLKLELVGRQLVGVMVIRTRSSIVTLTRG